MDPEEVKRAIKTCGITMAEFAKLAVLKNVHLKRWMEGNYRFSPWTVARIESAVSTIQSMASRYGFHEARSVMMAEHRRQNRGGVPYHIVGPFGDRWP